MEWRCHYDSECLLFVGITFILPKSFFFSFGWVLLGIQAIDKGIKTCVTRQFWTKFWWYTRCSTDDPPLTKGSKTYDPPPYWPVPKSPLTLCAKEFEAIFLLFLSNWHCLFKNKNRMYMWQYQPQLRAITISFLFQERNTNWGSFSNKLRRYSHKRADCRAAPFNAANTVSKSKYSSTYTTRGD